MRRELESRGHANRTSGVRLGRPLLRPARGLREPCVRACAQGDVALAPRTDGWRALLLAAVDRRRWDRVRCRSWSVDSGGSRRCYAPRITGKSPRGLRVLLPDADSAGVVRVATHSQRWIDPKALGPEQADRLTLSTGNGAGHPTHGACEVLTMAHTALRRACRQGRNCVVPARRPALAAGADGGGAGWPGDRRTCRHRRREIF
jgi:hypothetical protein